MWVYYLSLGVITTIMLVKVVKTVAYVIRRQHDAVRKEDWLDLFIEAFITR